MLDLMRRNANSWLMIILFAVIVFVFAINFGPWAGKDSGELPFAAEVNDHVISMAEFRFVYSNRLREIKRFRPEYSPKDSDTAYIRKLVIDQLVAQELLAQLGANNGLTISDQELAKTIKLRFFGKDRPFDRDEYARTVSGVFNSTEAQFEAQLRREMLAEKMAELLSTGANVTKAELWRSFQNKNNQVSLEFIKINTNFFEPSKKHNPEKLSNYSLAHKEEIAEYYHNKISEYRSPKKVRARHILVKVAPDATDEDKEKAKKKISETQKRVVEKKEDFAGVAREVSEDSTASKGGDLGFFGPGAMVKPFSEAAFALKKGEISEIIETPFGFHLIKVEDIKDPLNRKLEDVESEIAAILIEKNEQKELAKNYALKTLKQLKQKKLAKNVRLLRAKTKANEKLAPKLDSTTKFAKTARYIPKIGQSKEIARAAFELSKENPVSDKIFEVGPSMYLIKLKERDYADKTKFEEEKESLKNLLLGQRKRKFMRDYLEQLKKEAKINYNTSLYPQV